MASFKSCLVIVVLLLVKSSWSAPEGRGSDRTTTESTENKDVGAGVATQTKNDKLNVSKEKKDKQSNSYSSYGDSEGNQSSYEKDFSNAFEYDANSDTSGYINKSNEDKVDAGSTISVTNNDYSNVNHGSGVNHYKKWYDLTKRSDICTLSAGEQSKNDYMYYGNQMVDMDSVNHDTSVKVDSKDYADASASNSQRLNEQGTVSDKEHENSSYYKNKYVYDSQSDSGSTKQLGLLAQDYDRFGAAGAYSQEESSVTESIDNGGDSYATGGGADVYPLDAQI